jgi:aldose 1-epimerase
MEAKMISKGIATPINLTNHSYFNLAGHDSLSKILDHTLLISAGSFTPNDSDSIPTREVENLDGNIVMDFQRERYLSTAFIDMALNRGYDK